MPPPRLSLFFLFIFTIIKPTHSFLLHSSITTITIRPSRLAHPLHATPPASAPFHPSRTPATIQDFQSWLWTKGGVNLSASPLELRISPTGIGLHTTRPIEKDQILLAIPQSLILTPTLPLPFLEEMASRADLNDLGRLALRLLYEASATSSGGGFLPYLRVLPARDEMHLPFLWDDDEDDVAQSGRRESLLSFLAPSPFYDDILEARAEMKEEMTLLREACEKEKAEAAALLLLPLLTWETWSWARAITMSRPYMFVDERSHSSSSSSSSSLQLLPLIDMANHDDTVRYAVQKGDGIFTAKEDIQLIADRAYPQAGQEYMITYGPLSSASKLYSFGYLEEVPLHSSASSSPTVFLPAQGTALFIVSLKQDEREKNPSLHQTKQDTLSSINLTPEKQRIEVATRTQTHTPTSGPTLARVVIEDDVTVDVYEGEKERKKGKDGGVYGVPDGGVERLKRYLRLKHLTQGDLDMLLSSASASATQNNKKKQDTTHTQPSPQPSSPPSTLVWSLLSSPLRKEVELAAALDIVSLCSRELARVEHTLTHICTMLEEEEKLSNTHRDTDTHTQTHTDMYLYRLGLVKILLHGELLALRAVAELFMTAVEEMEGEGEE